MRPILPAKTIFSLSTFVYGKASRSLSSLRSLRSLRVLLFKIFSPVLYIIRSPRNLVPKLDHVRPASTQFEFHRSCYASVSRPRTYSTATLRQAQAHTDQPAPIDGSGGGPFSIYSELSKIKVAVVRSRNGSES